MKPANDQYKWDPDLLIYLHNSPFGMSHSQIAYAALMPLISRVLEYGGSLIALYLSFVDVMGKAER